MSVRDKFHKIAICSARYCGSPWAFSLACGVVLGWAIAGPFFRFSDTWQLTIGTITTVVTFVMVFLIQTSQNYDTRALQLKLDELIRSSNAHNRFADLEEGSEQEIAELEAYFRELRKRDTQKDS